MPNSNLQPVSNKLKALWLSLVSYRGSVQSIIHSFIHSFIQLFVQLSIHLLFDNWDTLSEACSGLLQTATILQSTNFSTFQLLYPTSVSYSKSWWDEQLPVTCTSCRIRTSTMTNLRAFSLDSHFNTSTISWRNDIFTSVCLSVCVRMWWCMWFR